MRAALPVVVALLCSSAVQAGEFEDAVAAYNNKNYTVA